MAIPETYYVDTGTARAHPLIPSHLYHTNSLTAYEKLLKSKLLLVTQCNVSLGWNFKTQKNRTRFECSLLSLATNPIGMLMQPIVATAYLIRGIALKYFAHKENHCERKAHLEKLSRECFAYAKFSLALMPIHLASTFYPPAMYHVYEHACRPKDNRGSQVPEWAKYSRDS